ncbi:transposase [Bradyrhizobium sp. 76]|nr:transposase [Bradyrhizobium sp. 76]
MSKLDHMLEPRPSVRRVEVIRESGRRRQFSADDKARFVEETLAPGAVVSEVARRHGFPSTFERQVNAEFKGYVGFASLLFLTGRDCAAAGAGRLVSAAGAPLSSAASVQSPAHSLIPLTVPTSLQPIGAFGTA